jgi:competence protein ComEC
MAMLYLAARALDLRSPPWHALAVAAALMVMLRPLDIRDPGFVLTFGATGALLAGAWWGSKIASSPPRGRRASTARWRRAAHRVARWVAASLLASAFVELTLVPVSAEAFSRVTGAGLVLNLVAVPLMAVIQIAGTVVVAAGPLETVAHAAGWVAAASASALVESARLVETSPLWSQRVPAPGALLLTAYYTGLAMLCTGRPRFRARGALLLGASLLAIVTGAPARVAGLVRATAEPALRLTMVDVGQAESLMLEAPGAAALLVDAGGAPFGGGFDVGRRVLAPALWAQGIQRVGALLVTHGDPDHLGGALAVLEDFSPRALWTGIPVPRHAPARELDAAASRAGIATALLRAGHQRTWGGARLRVLHPPAPDWERQQVRNDDSVVLEVVYGDVAVLLTGDISAEVERAIVPQLTPARVRVLKVAHHGSRTSSSGELLTAWPPHVAIVSCGRGNRFGHPTSEVLERLAAAGTRVFRTDRHGEIRVETDGKVVRVRTFTGERYER